MNLKSFGLLTVLTCLGFLLPAASQVSIVGCKQGHFYLLPSHPGGRVLRGFEGTISNR